MIRYSTLNCHNDCNYNTRIKYIESYFDNNNMDQNNEWNDEGIN